MHLPWWQDQFADLATWLPTFAMPTTVCASPILGERFRSSVLPELVAFDPSVPAIRQAVFELSELLLLSVARVGVGILLESAVLGVVLAVDRLRPVAVAYVVRTPAVALPILPFVIFELAAIVDSILAIALVR